MNQAPTLEQTYKEKINNLEEKIKFYENENQLQKQYIQSLKEQIELLKEKIINLEKNKFQKSEIDTIKPIKQFSSNSDVNFSEKEPIHFMTKHHANYIYCLAILKNKRLVSGGYDSKIIVYDKNYTNPELEINEHSAAVTSLIVSSNGNLISSSCDKTLKIFKIEENVKNDKISLSYYLIQTINTNHGNNIIHVRELSSNKLVSCSLDTKLNFYLSQNNNYSFEISIDMANPVYNILEVPDEKLVLSLNGELKLFDLKTRKIIKELKDISCYADWVNDNLCLIKPNCLITCGNSYIYVVDLVQFKLLNKINTNSNNISLCYLNNKLIFGTSNGMIQEFKVNEENLSKISFKENCHQNHIWQIINDDEGNLISCSNDNFIKVWNKI
jgi:hypothetical protein